MDQPSCDWNSPAPASSRARSAQNTNHDRNKDDKGESRLDERDAIHNVNTCIKYLIFIVRFATVIRSSVAEDEQANRKSCKIVINRKVHLPRSRIICAASKIFDLLLILCHFTTFTSWLLKIQRKTAFFSLIRVYSRLSRKIIWDLDLFLTWTGTWDSSHIFVFCLGLGTETGTWPKIRECTAIRGRKQQPPRQPIELWNLSIAANKQRIIKYMKCFNVIVVWAHHSCWFAV